MRSRKTKISCEEDLLEDLTNQSQHNGWKRAKRFGFNEEKNYRIEEVNNMGETESARS
jgi:hypothetical protein